MKVFNLKNIDEQIKHAETFGFAVLSLPTPKNSVLSIRLDFYGSSSIQSWSVWDGLQWKPLSGEELHETLSSLDYGY